MQETLVQFLDQEDPLEKGQTTHSNMLGFPCGSAGEESACSEEELGLMTSLGRSPGEGKVYPLQYSGLENSMNGIVHGFAKSQLRCSLSLWFNMSKVTCRVISKYFMIQAKMSQRTTIIKNTEIVNINIRKGKRPQQIFNLFIYLFRIFFHFLH